MVEHTKYVDVKDSRAKYVEMNSRTDNALD